ncbi:MAG: hypothetical protein FJ388_24880, partial [Verrucomicrobia bacterium]|nr:hypothetical protein [Verrucomicrobiota bacterium]
MKHQINRREFLARSTAFAAASCAWAGALHAATTSRPRVGSCMIGLLEAKQAGLDGAEVRVGPVA